MLINPLMGAAVTYINVRPFIKQLLLQEFLSVPHRLYKPKTRPLNQELLERFYLTPEDNTGVSIQTRSQS